MEVVLVHPWKTERHEECIVDLETNHETELRMDEGEARPVKKEKDRHGVCVVPVWGKEDVYVHKDRPNHWGLVTLLLPAQHSKERYKMYRLLRGNVAKHQRLDVTTQPSRMRQLVPMLDTRKTIQPKRSRLIESLPKRDHAKTPKEMRICSGSQCGLRHTKEELELKVNNLSAIREVNLHMFQCCMKQSASNPDCDHHEPENAEPLLETLSNGTC